LVLANVGLIVTAVILVGPATPALAVYAVLGVAALVYLRTFAGFAYDIRRSAALKRELPT
jgi:hypothetical protein